MRFGAAVLWLFALVNPVRVAADPLESRVAECNQAHDGDCLLDLAEFEAAAQAFAARSREGGPYAATALSRAVRLRRELGQELEVRTLADEFRRIYPRHPRLSEVAEEVFRLGELYEERGQRERLVAHWEMYLRDWAAAGGADRTIVAHARLGRLLLDASCPVAGVQGACVEIKREERKCPEREALAEWGNRPHWRGHSSYEAVSVLRHARDGGVVRKAEQNLKSALRLAGGTVRVWGSDPDERARRHDELADAVAESMLLLAYADRDAYLALNHPENLDFQQPSQYDSSAVACRKKNKAEWSGKRFVAWMEQKGALLKRLEQTYARALGVAAPQSAVQIAALFAEAESELGRSLYSEHGDGCVCRPHMHCGPDSEITGPLGENPFSALSTCLDIAKDMAVMNPWTVSCLAQANRLRQAAVPISAELSPIALADQPAIESVEPRKPSEHAASLIPERKPRPPARSCKGDELGVLTMADGSPFAWLFDLRRITAPTYSRPTPSSPFDHQRFLRGLLRRTCGAGTVVVETVRDRIARVVHGKGSCTETAQTFSLPRGHFTEDWARWTVDL